MAVRTLLIGLGGTGCRIVDRVAGMIKESTVPDHLIRCIGIDTDTNDMSEIENIEVISTSKEKSVKEYLDNTINWSEWFPNTSYIKAHNMLDGAAQMRPLSRLAFLETSSSNRLGKLEEAIKYLQLARGDTAPGNIRVMIVSSFAGGTGSGMFLHIALWIRRFFRKTYNSEVLIRGLFALPDMYMPSTSDLTQQQSKYANAYGAVRELNAINLVALGKSEKAKNINISFDGFFDSETDFGSASMMPYDLMFFVDNLNIRNRVLPEINHYVNLMANITYLQVYSPLRTPQATAEDNRFITIMESKGEALYGSAGAAALEYPYSDIVKYCGLRASVDSINSSWTFFDSEFFKALNDNKEQRKADPSIPIIRRDDFYIKINETILNEDPGQFRFIKDEIQDELDKRLVPRELKYFNDIMELILKRNEENNILELAKANCEVNKENINNREEITSHVYSIENSLKKYREAIDIAIVNDKSSLVQAIICDTFESIRSFNGGKTNITQLLKKNSKTVHPLSARLLLYRVYKLICEEFKSADDLKKSCIEATGDYKKHDYNKRTKNITEDAVTQAEYVTSLWGGKFNPQFKEFKNDYIYRSAEQRKNLDTYRECSYKTAVLGEVINRLEILIGKYELFFDNLYLIRDSLNSDIEALENAHESDTDLTTYVHASKTAKNKIYNGLNIQTSDGETHEVCDAISRAIYDETCSELKRKDNKFNTESNLTEEEKSENNLKTMEEVFRSNVVSHNTYEVEREYKAVLDINVYDALKLECSETGKEIKTVLTSVAYKGAPYLLYDTQGSIDSGQINVDSGDFVKRDNFTYSLAFWGLHPATEALILKNNSDLDNQIAKYFVLGDTSTVPLVTKQDRFSRYKIEYYQSSYGISLNNIKKFTEKNSEMGEFYKNYQERINKMIAGGESAITPHLSINWHLRQNLPYINEDKDIEDDTRVAEAFWMAMAYNAINLMKESDGGLYFYSKLKDAIGTQIMWDSSYLSETEIYYLFLALKDDEISIRKAVQLKNSKYAEDIKSIRNGYVDDKAFIKGLIHADKPEQNAVNILCNLANDPENPSKEYDLLKTALEKLIAEFCVKSFSNEKDIAQLIKKIKSDIIEKSVVPQKGNSSKEYVLFSDWI